VIIQKEKNDQESNIIRIAMESKTLKKNIIQAGMRAVEQLIKVAKEDIIKPDPEDELAADRLKNAAATKKLAIFDAFDILTRIENEKNLMEIEERGPSKLDTKLGFAERKSS
jgi:hypothetical protein